jgi:hypothetical protein
VHKAGNCTHSKQLRYRVKSYKAINNSIGMYVNHQLTWLIHVFKSVAAFTWAGKGIYKHIHYLI